MSDEKEKNLSSAVQAVFSQPAQNNEDFDKKEDVGTIIKEWLSPKHLKLKTRYTKRQVLAVTVLQSLASTYKVKTLNRFLTEYRMSKLSEEGKSSEELENILTARLPKDEDVDLRRLSKYLE